MNIGSPPPGTRLYVLQVAGGLALRASGPFATRDDQFAQAKALFADHNSEDDGIFGLDILPDGTPVTHVYSSDAFAESD